MQIFALLAKYTSAGLASARTDGLETREAAGLRHITKLGGTVLGWFFLSSPEWDYVEIADLPSDDDAYALLSIAKSTPAFLKVQATRLFSSVEADAAIAHQLNWAPPGS